MNFVGLEDPIRGEPLAEVRVAGFLLDLHNALFTRLLLDLEDRSLRLVWRLDHEYDVAGIPNNWEALDLVFLKVRRLRITGDVPASHHDEAAILDFFERPLDAPTNLRFVFLGGTEIEVSARTCEAVLQYASA